MIRAGTLTKRIQFLEDQAARTASGAPGPADWQPVSSTWHAAAIQPHTGAERIVAGQREATVTDRKSVV